MNNKMILYMAIALVVVGGAVIVMKNPSQKQPQQKTQQTQAQNITMQLNKTLAKDTTLSDNEIEFFKLLTLLQSHPGVTCSLKDNDTNNKVVFASSNDTVYVEARIPKPSGQFIQLWVTPEGYYLASRDEKGTDRVFIKDRTITDQVEVSLIADFLTQRTADDVFKACKKENFSIPKFDKKNFESQRTLIQHEETNITPEKEAK